MVKKSVSANTNQDELQTFLNHYLSSKHRDNIQAGCPVAALSSDFGAETIATRKIFAQILNETIEERRKLLKLNNITLTRDEWMGVMCTYVGAITISRSCKGDILSDEILINANKFLKRLTKEL